MHKEVYFTEDTIREKSRELLASLKSFRRRHPEIQFQPSQAALLILDMQKYFLQEDSHAFVPSAPAIVEKINKLISFFLRMDQPVFATQHINTPEDGGMMLTWWQDLIKSNTSCSHFITTLNLQKSIQIKKTQYDAFLHTSLEQQLHQYNIKQVVITGIMTHLCCESTARSAFMHGFEVFFTVDGTATYTQEQHHASLLTLSHGFAIPVLVEELLSIMKKNES